MSTSPSSAVAARYSAIASKSSADPISGSQWSEKGNETKRLPVSQLSTWHLPPDFSPGMMRLSPRLTRPIFLYQSKLEFCGVMTRPIFLYQSKLEFFGVNSPFSWFHAGFAYSRDSMKRLWSTRPSDVLAFSLRNLCNSANAAGVRSANALCGRS